jgi:hypothetical protein
MSPERFVKGESERTKAASELEELPFRLRWYFLSSNRPGIGLLYHWKRKLN